MIQKRTIIAIIITIVVVIITNKYWLVFKPMPVDFDIQGSGICNIEVQLNKKNDDKFANVKSQNIILDLNTNNHASFKIKRSRYPKRMRIVIAELKNKNPIEIKNITLRNGKYEISELGEFVSQSADLVEENDILKIYPKDSIVILEYKKTLNARTVIKFDFKLFVIILTLTFLLFYKLSNYVADFKSVEKKSRIEIIFLAIFFVFLFIPMSHINRDAISKQENRTLTKWQPLINNDGEINYDFGVNFNEWFNDRFCLRSCFIYVSNYIKSGFTDVVKTKNGIYNKRTNWMFVDDSDWYASLYDSKFQAEIADNLNKFNAFCKDNNIKFYLLIVPYQNDIYYKEGEPYLTKTSVETKMEAVEKILSMTDFPTINAYNELKQNSKDVYTYYKTDWHWTDDGAFIGYQLLMNKIKADYKDLKILSKSDFNITQSNKVRSDWGRDFHNGEVLMYHFHDFENKASEILDVKYNYYEHKGSKDIKATVVDIPFKKEKTFYYKLAENNLKFMQIGTSMNESLLQFTPYSFKNLKYIRLNNVQCMTFEESFKILKHYKSNILEYKPNIIVLCLTPSSMHIKE